MPPTRCSFISRMITVGHLREGGCHLIPRTPQTRRSSCQSHCTAIAKQVGRPSKQTSTSLIMRTITNGLKIRRRGCVMVVCVCAPVALETAASPLEILSRVRPFVPPDQRPSVSIRFLFSTEMSAWKNSNHLTRGKAGGLFSGRRTCRHTMGFKIRHSSKLRHGFETFHASGMQFKNACTIVQSRKPNRPRFFFSRVNLKKPAAVNTYHLKHTVSSFKCGNVS